MRDEVADPDDVRWFHFYRLLAGLAAAGWIVWNALLLPRWDAPWYIALAGSVVVVTVLALLAASVFHRWSGFFDTSVLKNYSAQCVPR